ncbi:MAG: PAS domain S-box protein [Nitrospirae bacterium]|nr:PAS domain S-box protein [Nitrospirota bacterium]
MKNRLIFSLTLLFVFFSIGAALTVFHTYRVTKNLESVIALHRIELIRKDLVINLQSVQGNLYTAGTVFGKELDVIVENVTAMNNSIHSCTGCHHSKEMTARLVEVGNLIEQYEDAISYLITTTANPDRVERLKIVAVGIGDSLLSKTQEMAFIADKNLTNKTMASIEEINKSRFILLTTLLITFFISIIIAITLTKKTTKPVYELVKAVREIESGNLGYKISYQDKTEFGELALSFNKMALTLQKNINKIEESEKRYRMLFEGAEEAIFILEAEGKKAGRIVAANKAAAEMHGYTVDELLTLNIKDLDTPDAANEVPNNIKKILNGERIKAEITHLKKDGTAFPVEISAGLLELSDHKYILAFDRDITERKQAEEQFLRTEQMVVCGEVTTGLAHEIKNPLAGIKASIELFSTVSTLSEEEKDILQKIIGEIRRIESLLKGILNFARPPKPNFIAVDVNNILDTALIFSLKPASSAQNSKTTIQIIKDLDSHLPEIIADPMQLSQIFLNLFLNAVEAMRDGGILTVKTLYNPTGNSILISISDTGKGVEKSLIDQIFNPFFTTKPKGTGLGLSISKRLIEQHNGVLTFENNPDGGATFIINLPVKQKEKVQLA